MLLFGGLQASRPASAPLPPWPEASRPKTYSEASRRYPPFSGLPLLREFLTARERTKHRHCENFEILEHLAKRIDKLGVTDLFHEGIPVNTMSYNETCHESLKFFGCNGCFPILERSVDCLEKRVRVEVEVIRVNPYVVEVLHPAVGPPERHHSLELLRDCRLDWIGEQLDCVVAQEDRVFD